MNSKQERANELIDRTKAVALRVVKLFAALPTNTICSNDWKASFKKWNFRSVRIVAKLDEQGRRLSL